MSSTIACCVLRPNFARGPVIFPLLTFFGAYTSIFECLSLSLPADHFKPSLLSKVVKVGASTRRAFALPCAALCEPKYGARPSLRTTTSARGLLHAFRRREPACLLPSLFTSSPRGASARSRRERGWMA